MRFSIRLLLIGTILILQSCTQKCGCPVPIPYESLLYGASWQWTASGTQTPASTGETRAIHFFNDDSGEVISQQVNGVVVKSARWTSRPVINEAEGTIIFSLSDGTFLKVHNLPYANNIRRIECTDYLLAFPGSKDTYNHQYQAK
ncbi:hypothetical protein [uncultured Fibrella sp.]|uniref:hypothetical protein n=1 Tax=uncultured Fibrella sp. TaxID=1284596 RepID=UPI0035CBD78E